MAPKLTRIVGTAILGYYVYKYTSPFLLPYGPARSNPAPGVVELGSVASVQDKDGLHPKHGRISKIYPRNDVDHLFVGPETVVLGPKGTIFVLTEHGNLVQLKNVQPKKKEKATTTTSNDDDKKKKKKSKKEKEEDDENETDESGAAIFTAEVSLVKHLRMGRPLGGKFTDDGSTLYVADALLGLIRVKNVLKSSGGGADSGATNDNKAKVELVASSVMEKLSDSDTTVESPLLYVNDVTIGPVTGKVYFTDSTDIVPPRVVTTKNVWDTMYAAKYDLMRGGTTGTGRLLVYDPTTNQVSVLARGIHFANGVATDKDETFVLINATFEPAILKFHLKGEKAGTLETLVSSKHLTGYPDGLDCVWSSSSKTSNNKCYAVAPSSFIPLHRLWNALPNVMSVFLRTIFMSLPKQIAPPIKKYGCLIEIDPNNNSNDTESSRILHDPSGKGVAMLTGVTVDHANGKLYMGSLKNPYIAVYHLEKSPSTTTTTTSTPPEQQPEQPETPAINVENQQQQQAQAQA